MSHHGHVVVARGQVITYSISSSLRRRHVYLLDLVDANDRVLFSCMAKFAQNQDEYELVDSLVQLSGRWRCQTPFVV